MIHMTTGYSLETYGAKIALEKSMPMMYHAIRQLPDEALQIVDFGIADGGTALDFFESVLSEIRTTNSHPITFIGNDLPSNPHNDLALNLSKLREKVANLRTFIAPVSFYEQVVADATTNLGFSATAMHWLSKLPGQLQSHMHANSANDHEREQFRQQALDDFEALMQQRAKELQPGAHLILVNLAEADEGQSLGRNHSDLAMFDYMQDTFAETLRAHDIPEKVLQDTNVQNFYKRAEDFEEALNRKSLSDEFKIVEHRIEHTPCPYRAEFDNNKKTEQFADGLMKTIRSWSRHTFLKALDMHGYDLAIADRFYDRLRAKIAESPTQYSMDYIHSFLQLEKQ